MSRLSHFFIPGEVFEFATRERTTHSCYVIMIKRLVGGSLLGQSVFRGIVAVDIIPLLIIVSKSFGAC